MQIETDLTDDLYAWGKWARACPSRSLGYPYQTPFNRYRGAGVSSAMMITEDYAVKLDQAIAKVFHGDKDTIELLIGKFQYCLSYRDIQERTGTNKDKARLLVENAVSWLNGYFVGIRAA